MTANIALHQGNILFAPVFAERLTAAGLLNIGATVVEGFTFASLPYNITNIRLLTAFGVRVPTPLAMGGKVKPSGEGSIDIRPYAYPGPFEPFEHQIDSCDFIASHPRCIVLNSPGCVDSETEYLSPTGWAKISEYKGGKVAQCDPYDGYKATFVDPIAYVKKPCDKMIRIVSEHGVDQLLSPEHRVLSQFENGIRVVTALDVLVAHQTKVAGFRGKFPTTFMMDREGVDMTDAELRLHVAVTADGHIQTENTRWVLMGLKRPRKIKRIQELLVAAGVPYTIKPIRPAGFFAVRFTSKLLKGFDHLWECSQHQLQVLADEFVHWDGSHLGGGASAFSTAKKPEADFVQYAYAATGRTARLYVYDHLHKFPEHRVHARRKGHVLSASLPKNDNGKTRGVFLQPSTDGFKYCFEVPTSFLVLRRNGCVFATGNTGKTASAIWAMDYLMTLGVIKKVLVFCPLSCVEDVWIRELFALTPWRKVINLTGPTVTRREMLNQPADFIITNHDAANRMAKDLADPKLMIDHVIGDEATNFKTESASRTKGFVKIVKGKSFTLMTGTPCAQSPVDAYMLCKMLNPKAPQTLGRFTDLTMVKVSDFVSKPKKDAHITVAQYLTPAIRYSKEECLNLPPITFENRHCPLTPAQEKAIKSLKKDWVYENKTLGHKVIAINGAARLTKILQVSQGSVIGEDGVVELDIEPKIRAIMDLIEESESKTIVFASYRATVERLRKSLSKKYGCGVVHGDITASQRSKVFKEFSEDPAMKVLIAHPQTTSHGLTLTAASTTIWLGPSNKYETYSQANERTNRPGQVYNMRIINLYSTREEQIVFSSARDAAQTEGLLLELKQLLHME